MPARVTSQQASHRPLDLKLIMPNIIYILTNEAMHGLVKIGYTQNLEQRMRELSAPSGVPLPFECHYAAEVPDHAPQHRAHGRKRELA